MRLIVTRPAVDAEAMAATLRSLGHETECHPLLEIVPRPCPASALEGVGALIVTSRNALRSLAENGGVAGEAARGLPVFCVGEATAALARQMGFTTTHTGPGTAKELAPLILRSATPSTGTLLYLTGDHLAFDLEAILTAGGLTVRRVVAYESRELSADAAAHLVEKLRTGVDGVILMSPRSASVLARLLGAAQSPGAIICYCLSEAVAKPLRGLANVSVCVARHPTEADLLALAGIR